MSPAFTPEQDKALTYLRAARLFYHNTDDAVDNAIVRGFFEDSPDECWAEINLNDTFAWACADSESVPFDQLPEVARLHRGYGWCGILYWVLKQRGLDWTASRFFDVQRKVQFVAMEEQLRAQSESDSDYAFTKAEYTIKEQP